MPWGSLGPSLVAQNLRLCSGFPSAVRPGVYQAAFVRIITMAHIAIALLLSAGQNWL